LLTRLEQDDVLSESRAQRATPKRPRGWENTIARGRRWNATLSITATLCIAIVAWLILGHVTHIQTTQREYVTGPDERATIRLGDGSQIVLGPNTRVRYATPFGARDRNVSLTGKAYFTVASRASTPFVVYTAYSATQVLGTTFVVKAMPNDSVVQVVVESGKVALRQRTSQPGTGTTLVHGELGRLSASGLMTVSHDVDAAVYTSWSQDRVTFSATPASTVVRALEERYDLHFVLPPHFDPSTPVSFAIDVETGDQAAQILATMLHLTFTRTGRVVTLRPM
jgi:ferric-dicitrate binding protein FerR (iron transport regulator)